MTTNRLKNFDMGTLRSFSMIVESGSMTRAASRLFMTQSAISMQIKRLENNLGFSVFDRSAQGMKTTIEGEQLLHFAHQMLAINDEAMGRLTSPDYEGEIRIGVPHDVIYPHIPSILKEFNRDFPRVQIHLSTGGTFVLRQQFNHGEQDIILTTEQRPEKGGKVIDTRRLEWIGAEQGVGYKKQPLPLGISTNCAFRSCVIKILDEASIDWIDVVASADLSAGDALASADLCVIADLGCISRPGLAVIKHAGHLPILPEFSIAMYVNHSAANLLPQSLAEYVTRAYS